MKIVWLNFIFTFLFTASLCFSKPREQKKKNVKTPTDIALQMKRIDKKANEAESKTKEMLDVLKKLIKKNKLKYKSFLHKEIE